MSNNRGVIPHSLFSWPREQLSSSWPTLEDELSHFTNWPNWQIFSQRDIQIESDEKNFYVSVPIPGFDQSEVDISINNNTLYIKAEHREEKKEKSRDRRTHLQATRSYSRVITLPEQIDESHVSATTENGLLSIQLPKVTTKSGSKKIPIKKK